MLSTYGNFSLLINYDLKIAFYVNHVKKFIEKLTIDYRLLMFFYTYFQEKNYFLHLKLTQLNESVINERIYPKKPYANPLYTVPSLSKQLKYLFQTLFIIIGKAYKKLFLYRNEWHTAYQFVDSWNNSVLRKSIKIKNPKNRFFNIHFFH